MQDYDVIIIGGGIVGTSISRELSRYKIKTLLLEKEEELAFGVSKSNSGIIHPGTQNPPGSLKGKLCVQGNSLTRKLAKELGLDLYRIGELIVAFTAEDILRLNVLKKEAQKLGVSGLRIVDSKWLKKNEPNLNKDALGALYAPTACVISPYRWVYDLAKNAAQNGVEIYTSYEVKDIQYLACSERNRKKRFEIVTDKGIFRAGYLINAAGLLADKVSNMAGIDNFKIKACKGEEFMLDMKKAYLTKHLLFPLPTKNSKGILVTRTADGNPMIGPTAEDVDDKEDLSTSEEGRKKVIEGAKKLVPSIDEKDIIAYFSGLRPVAGADFIVRHEHKVSGFINVVGIQSPGLTAAPAIAFMVKDILRKNGLKLKKKLFFKKYRKKTIHLFSLPFKQSKKLIKKDASYGDIVCRCEMVSAKEVEDAIKTGAKTMDGIKFRTRAQAGRCHGSFCTTRIMKMLSDQTGKPVRETTKRGEGSEIVKKERCNDN
ncbi:MAG: NAD(P)/FAD-dependent oxidoreductase [Candidatus Omnitrophota bacterium]